VLNDRTIEQSPLGVSIGEESFTDLDYVDRSGRCRLLVEMLETLMAGLLVLLDEAAPLSSTLTSSPIKKMVNDQ